MIKHHTGFFVSVWHDADETPKKFIMFSTCGRCGAQVKPDVDMVDAETGEAIQAKFPSLQEAMIHHHLQCFVSEQKQEQACELD